MLLVRLRTDDGLVGLGEAVPLALRGGDARAVERAIREELGALRRSDSRLRGEEPLRAAVDASSSVAGRRSPAPATAAIEMALLDLAGKAAGPSRSGRLLGRRVGAAGRAATRPSSAGEPEAVAADARALGRARLRHLQAQARASATTSRRCAPCGSAVGPRRADPGGRQRGLGRRRGAGRPRAMEPLGIELAEQPVADDRGDRPRAPSAPTVPIAADESVADGEDAERAGAARLRRWPR